VGVVTAVLALFSLALAPEAESSGEHLLAFGPPLLVLGLCGWVVRRGIVMPQHRPR
jgi:hypothetical protein